MARTTLHLIPERERPAHLAQDVAFLDGVCVEVLAQPHKRATGVEIRTSPSGTPYVFKLGRAPMAKRFPRGIFAVASRSRRAFELGGSLHGAGISTPRPVAFAERCLGPVVLRDALVMEFIEAPTLGERLHGDPDPEAWVRRAAVSIHAMHAAGVRHRDLKASNLLARERPGHPPDVVILDLDGARRGRGRPSFEIRVRDLARLAVSLEVLGSPARIERAYADLEGWTEDEVGRAATSIANFLRFKRAVAERRGRDLS